MAKLFEYIINIKDKASAAAAKIDKAVGQIPVQIRDTEKAAITMQSKVSGAFSSLYNKAKSAVKGPQFLTKSIDELENKLRDVNRARFGTKLKSEFKATTREAKKLEKQIDRLKRGLSGGLGGKVAGWRKDFANDLPGARLLKNPLVMSGAAIGGIWAASMKAMEAGKEKMKLQVLTGSDEIGQTLYDSLTKFATDTVFGNELYDMATQMLANGIKDADVMPVMKELGDISMGDSAKLGQLSLAFAQINGKGHLAGQELLQLINAGFNPLQVISEKTGVSMSSLTEKMSKGQISIEDVRGAMQMATGPGGKFAGMLNKVASTPYGQLENLRGQLGQMMIEMGDVFLPILSKLMVGFAWLGDKMGPFLKPAIAIIGVLATGILAIAAAQWIWNAAQLASPTTWIVLGIIALIAAITWVVTALSGWGAAWSNLMTGLKFTWFEFTGAFKMLWLQTVNQFMNGVNLIEKAWYKVKSLWDKEGASEGLQKLKDEGEARSKHIAYQKGLNKAYDNIARDAFGSIVGEKGLHGSGKTLGGVANKIKKSLLPGMAGAGGAGGGAGAGAGATAQSREAVATGGTKNTTINITIGKQIESLTVVSNNVKEGATKIRDIILDEMTRAAGMAAALGG